MLDRLPHLIDPVSFADKERTLQGQMPLAKLNRLADVLLDTTGSIEVDLSFSKDKRLATVRGHLRGTLVLECRTCLEAINFPVDVQVNLAVVRSIEQAERLSGEYEPLMLDEEEDKLPLHELLEDELLLALPAFPRHAHDCLPYKQSSGILEPKVDKAMQSPSNNPFSVLAKLKK